MDPEIAQRLRDDEEARKKAPTSWEAHGLLWPTGILNLSSLGGFGARTREEMESRLYPERHPFIRRVKVLITIIEE